MFHPSPDSARHRVLATARGSWLGAFGPIEWTLLTGVALTWGASFILVEVGLESLAPGAITWMRLTLGFLVLTIIPGTWKRVDRRDYPRFILLGITWLAIPFLLFPIAQQYIDSALAGMLMGTIPIFSAAISIVLTRALPRIRQAVGIALGFAGAISISLPAARVSPAAAGGVLLLLLATFFHGLSFNLAVPLQQRYGAPAVMLRAIGVGAAVTTPFGLAGLASSEWSTGPVMAVVMLGIMNPGVAFVIVTTLVGRVGSTRGGVAVYFVPIVAMVLGVVFRSEIVFPIQWAGTAVVLFGAWLTSRREE